jgi:hypothetical protein
MDFRYGTMRIIAKFLSTLCVLPALLGAMTIAAEKPRVAVLVNEGGKHGDEFDAALKSLGWEAEKIPAKVDAMKALPERLKDFDLLIAAPLFQFPKVSVLPGDDRGKYRKFVEDGGMIAVTDGSYPGVREWLADIDPELGGLETGKCNSSQWAVNGVTADPERAHPLRFFPSRITEPNSWPHFHQPAQGSKWEVVANCSEGEPVTFARRMGKGYVSLSALRQPSAEQLGNFYACLLLSRAGISLKAFELPELSVGEGLLRLEFAEGGAPKSGSFIYEITPDGGKSERFTKELGGKTLELAYRVSARGAVSARLYFSNGSGEKLLFSRRAELPELLTIQANAYRGILSTERRSGTVKIGIGLAPDKENLEGAEVRLSVVNAQGSGVAGTVHKIGKEVPSFFRQAVELDQKLPAGAYVVKAKLEKNGSVLAQASTNMKILSPSPGQTIVDEDHTLLVDGKPFFPLGLYHVKPEDYGAVADLGINTVQFWTWHRKAGLDKAQEHGLKAIFELNHKSEKIIQDVVRDQGDHPAVLMWYGMDEPAEGSHGMAEMMRRVFNEADDRRPVFMVSCRPDIFGVQSGFANVFAHDPYGKPEKALDWMIKASDAVKGMKPIICVPGVFGKETAEELRATAYTALAKDARGIMWYPWQQTGGGPQGIGLKNSPEQQEVIRALCAEIKALTPALTSPERNPFSSANGKLHGIFCEDGEKDYLIMVNTTPGKIVASASVPKNGTFKDFFGTAGEIEVKDGKFEITLEPYGTRVFMKD